MFTSLLRKVFGGKLKAMEEPQIGGMTPPVKKETFEYKKSAIQEMQKIIEEKHRLTEELEKKNESSNK